VEPDSDGNVYVANGALIEEVLQEEARTEESWADGVDIIGLPGEYTYVRSTIPIGRDINEVSAITVISETIYGVAERWSSDTTEGKISFFSIDLETEEIFFYPSSTDLTGTGNIVRVIAANNNGEIFFVNHKFISDNETLTSEEVFLLSQVDTLGNVSFTVDITEYLGFSEQGWVNQPHAIVLDDAGNIFVKTGDASIVQFDSSGVYQFSVPHPEGTWTGSAGIPFQRTDGTVLFPIWDLDEGNGLFYIDNELQRLIPYQSLPDANSFLPGLHGTELFLTTDVGVYSYCLESGEQNRVFHWLEIDVWTSSIFHAGEGRFAFLDSSGAQWWTDTIGVLTRTLVQDDTRTIVTMASLSPNYWFIREFNRQSTEYRIVVLDYSDYDISAAMTRFNINMIAGIAPDIIDFTHLNYRDLANGGFLADINVWFDNDSHISRTDFHERVFEVLEVNGNLYAVAPSFFIKTYLAPASLVGSTPGITLDRLMQLDAQFNDGNSLLQNAFAQSFIDTHSMINRSRLMDFDMGTVHFETDEFIQVLEYAGRMEYANISPHSELSAPNYEHEHVPFEVDIRRGNDHISFHMIDNLDELYVIELHSGREITPIGFPVEDGVGSLMLPISLFGIGEGAQNPSGAWAFIRFMLTTMQGEMRDGILVSRAAFDEWAIQTMNPPPMVDSPELSDLYIDGVRIDFVPIKQDQVNRTLEMIETLGGVFVEGDEIVVNIVAEETGGFFRGHRSAEDTARIIQNRVEIYVSERR